jgi:hypothetical protein
MHSYDNEEILKLKTELNIHDPKKPEATVVYRFPFSYALNATYGLLNSEVKGKRILEMKIPEGKKLDPFVFDEISVQAVVMSPKEFVHNIEKYPTLKSMFIIKKEKSKTEEGHCGEEGNT